MKSPEKILIALNTVEINEPAIKTSKKLSDTYKSQLVFLHVFPENQKHDKETVKNIEKYYEKLEKEGLGRAQRIIEYGDFVNKVLEKVDSVEAKMILTESGIRDQNLDLMVPQIMRKTDLPVWCVKQNEAQHLNKILCPVDFSSTSKRAFTDAVHIARDLKAELVVLTVSEPVDSVSEFISESEHELNHEQLENEEQNLEDFLKSTNTRGVNIIKDVQQGSAVNEIITKIRDHQAGLLVIGTHARKGIERKLIGSVTEQVINNAPGSFLAVKSRSLFN